MKKIYLAGPEVFLPDAEQLFRQKIQLCFKHGLRGITPLDNEIALENRSPREAAFLIYQANIDMIVACDAVIANITPFRGIHMDPGTAFEIGFAVAHQKPVAVYTHNPNSIQERIAQNQTVFHCPIHHRPKDEKGYWIEEFGLSENLMIQAPLLTPNSPDWKSGHRDPAIVLAPQPEESQIKSLSGFEECVLYLKNKL